MLHLCRALPFRFMWQKNYAFMLSIFICLHVITIEILVITVYRVEGQRLLVRIVSSLDLSNTSMKLECPRIWSHTFPHVPYDHIANAQSCVLHTTLWPLFIICNANNSLSCGSDSCMLPFFSFGKIIIIIVKNRYHFQWEFFVFPWNQSQKTIGLWRKRHWRYWLNDECVCQQRKIE